MGKRGPAPKPTALKELEGTARKDRATTNEPRPDVRIPSTPNWLGKDAKREWRRITKELEAVGMISQLDRTTLALYCQALEEYLEAAAEVDKEGLTAITSKGTLIQHPVVGIRNDAWRRVLKAAAEFGMTPSSRTRSGACTGAHSEVSMPLWTTCIRSGSMAG